MVEHDPVVEVRLSDLETDIRLLEHQIRDSERVLADKRRQFAELTNRAAPVSALPTEILVVIFGYLRSHEKSPFPLSTSHVIRRWRDVVIHTPSMWTNIRLGRQLPKSEDLLSLYLCRSRDCLLDITLFFYFEAGDVDWGTATPPHFIPGLLLSEVSRWRRLVVRTRSYQTLFWTFESLRALSAPCLEYYEMDYDEDNSRGIGGPIFTGGAPALTSLTLRDISLGNPPLIAITDLEICPPQLSSCFYTEFKSLLTASSVLRRLIISDYLFISDYDANRHEPIGIPSLLSLKISFPQLIHSLHRYHLLSLIAAPNLESLTLDHLRASQMFNFSGVVQVFPLAIKFPKLRVLEVDLHVVPDGRLSELCFALPAITHVLGGGTHLLEILDASDGKVMWPQLQSITVPVLWCSSHLDTLYNVVSSRVAAGHPIARLQVPSQFYEMVSTDRLTWLRERVELA